LAQQYTSPIPGLRIGPACEADLSAGIHPVEERKKEDYHIGGFRGPRGPCPLKRPKIS